HVGECLTPQASPKASVCIWMETSKTLILLLKTLRERSFLDMNLDSSHEPLTDGSLVAYQARPSLGPRGEPGGVSAGDRRRGDAGVWNDRFSRRQDRRHRGRGRRRDRHALQLLLEQGRNLPV